MSDDPHIDYFNMGPWPVYVGFTTSKGRFRKEMERLCPGETVGFMANSQSNASTHFLTKRGGLTCIITMQKPKGVTQEQIAGLIAHEATHVAQEIWSQIGEHEPGKEAEAYLVQHIVQCSMQVAYKTRRVRKTEP